MDQLTLKTSTIFVAKAGTTRVFHSVDDIPEDLRRELDETTNGFNSATILIADRRGRAEIMRSLQGLPTILRTRIEATLEPAAATDGPLALANDPPDSMLDSDFVPTALQLRLRVVGLFLRQSWYMLLVPAGAGIALWVAFGIR